MATSCSCSEDVVICLIRYACLLLLPLADIILSLACSGTLSSGFDKHLSASSRAVDPREAIHIFLFPAFLRRQSRHFIDRHES